jgi:K+-sensing histidine kinase KdpD
VLDNDDDGPGSSEAAANGSRDDFARRSDTQNRTTGGVGLGLAIVNDVLGAAPRNAPPRSRSPGARGRRLPRA